MNPQLVYDAATMSRTPQSVALVAAGLAVVAAGLWLWKRWRGHGSAVLTGWFTAAALLMAAVSVASEVERRQIAGHPDIRVAEGPVVHPSEWRTRRAGKDVAYTRWQGFWIGEVGFSYALNVGTNYFNNSAPQALDLREGLLLRVHYVEERDGTAVVRHIVRVERVERVERLPS
jgi:hypothetical protein